MIILLFRKVFRSSSTTGKPTASLRSSHGSSEKYLSCTQQQHGATCDIGWRKTTRSDQKEKKKKMFQKKMKFLTHLKNPKKVFKTRFWSSKVFPPKCPESRPEQLVLGQTGGRLLQIQTLVSHEVPGRWGERWRFARNFTMSLQLLSDPKPKNIKLRLIGKSSVKMWFERLWKKKCWLFVKPQKRNSGVGVQLVQSKTCASYWSWSATCNWRGCKVEWWCNWTSAPWTSVEISETGGSIPQQSMACDDRSATSLCCCDVRFHLYTIRSFSIWIPLSLYVPGKQTWQWTHPKLWRATVNVWAFSQDSGSFNHFFLGPMSSLVVFSSAWWRHQGGDVRDQVARRVPEAGIPIDQHSNDTVAGP